jgi:hypothetical protein
VLKKRGGSPRRCLAISLAITTPTIAMMSDPSQTCYAVLSEATDSIHSVPSAPRPPPKTKNFHTSAHIVGSKGNLRCGGLDAELDVGFWPL